jgi:hypothetical protein
MKSEVAISLFVIVLSVWESLHFFSWMHADEQ